MELAEPDKLWLGGDKYVRADEIDKVSWSGDVILKSGERVHSRRSVRSLARDLDRLSRLRRLFDIITRGGESKGRRSVLSTGEASEITGYSMSSLRRAVRQGQIDATKSAGQWRVDAESLYLWFAEHW